MNKYECLFIVPWIPLPLLVIVLNITVIGHSYMKTIALTLVMCGRVLSMDDG